MADLTRYRSDNRKFEHDAVHQKLHGPRAPEEVQERVHGAADHEDHPPALVLHEARQIDDHLREGGQIGAESLEQRLELRDHEDQQDDRHDDGDGQHGDRIEERLLDLLLQGLGLFLVGRDLVQQGLERAGLLAGLHQVHEQSVEMKRVLGERFVQRAAALDVRLDVEHQLLHRGLLVAVADDLEGLHHGNAGRHHGGELPAEYRDVRGVDLAAAAEQLLALRLDPGRGDALAAQIGAQRRLVHREGLAADLVAALVLAFPKKLGFFLGRCCRYRHKSILALPTIRW